MKDSRYSTDFAGADMLEVVEIDYTQESHPTQIKQITDVGIIEKFVRLLVQMPRGGKMMAKMGPVVVYTVTAYKKGEPFAHVEFYNEMLKTESTGFLGLGVDDQFSKMEKELFEIIKMQKR